ncbi:MAG: SDR family NAD(P)-dependent oxidoreductase, partial [Candidatus Hydrogenedentes bacterium]|nr:SDR family NAD(P)-dependent oxidoreductase [Candidatus Hydrogenedentota bacterium]
MNYPLFDLTGKNAIVTGGGGALGGAMAEGLAEAGARVAITSLTLEESNAIVDRIVEKGGQASGYALDIYSAESLEVCKDAILSDFGTIDILLNAVGGNMKSATTSPDQSFFDIPEDAISKVMDLNLARGVIIPTQLFAKAMLDNKDGGSIINITSMNAVRPLTRIPGYSAAKAALHNFTQWLAVHMAQEYDPKFRVNSIAPGFFLTAQNRFLLTDEATGEPTERGKRIIDHTPMD